MINGLKEGYGVYFFDNKKFSGYWKNGKEDGKGILEENGIFVNGIWSNGQLTHVQKEILEDEKAEIIMFSFRSLSFGSICLKLVQVLLRSVHKSHANATACSEYYTIPAVLKFHRHS